jgi:glutamate racemase
MNDERPIGVFDSGLGGLTVVKELYRLMPQEKVVYLGDTARCPYGGRSDETIISFGNQDARFLESMDIKLLIVACNTVSSVALEQVRKAVEEIPVIGVVLPGCKAAITRTAEKKIGVIGTAATIRASSYKKGIKKLDPSIKVYCKECPLFVPLVEEGLVDNDIAYSVVQYYLYELIDIGIDCLILGCTHYPLLMEAIQGTVSSRIELIDSAMWAAKEAQDILDALNARSAGDKDGFEQSRFYITDFVPNFERNAARFLGNEINSIEHIQLEQLVNLAVEK